ncbi:hypothetical protein GALMADRAFT_924836 [Galerina marginata CBS 339.88]|uniref:Uncharacterized protein n=1 Tax=Galerina marginata (strain CBS 339.88) TaxID=685588 RepID=A0A067SE38_GALM3|nr:hypothetical protein GALMADRAFT_924836 [Galerina marginata CBS 339.88]
MKQLRRYLTEHDILCRYLEDEGMARALHNWWRDIHWREDHSQVHILSSPQQVARCRDLRCRMSGKDIRNLIPGERMMICRSLLATWGFVQLFLDFIPWICRTVRTALAFSTTPIQSVLGRKLI